MSLKQIIRRSQIFNPVVGRELVMPGEPMIYSVKYPVGQRTRGVQFFRNMKWKSLLKSFFRSFYRTTTPLVIGVEFYVSPPMNVKVSAPILRQESMPAVMSFELCDYTLSFLEMLHHVLFNSYKQVVKLDVVKFYSSNPRTVVKFMKWDEHVKLQSIDSDNAKAQSISSDGKGKVVQPKRTRNGTSSELCTKEVPRQADAAVERPAACDSALCSTGSSKPTKSKSRCAKLPATHQEAGRGQSGEIS